MRRSIILIALLAVNFTLSSSFAENGVPITPGEWEMTSVTTSDTLDMPNIQTVSRCIAMSEITASDLTPNRGECQISESTAAGSSLNWRVACDMTVGTMHGTGVFDSKMDSGSGTMDILMNVQNDQFALRVSWDAKRIGECHSK